MGAKSHRSEGTYVFVSHSRVVISMSLGFFVLSSLDLLNAIDKIATNDRLAWIDWIYEQQSPQGGFSGGPSLRTPEVSRVSPLRRSPAWRSVTGRFSLTLSKGIWILRILP